ncbi:LEA type 2 family protein [Pseudomaricurvus sp.]|uniref:LEA type 2 family protein n=1 Tax=Pseudomaricurvus sp. TaxID=2004510 RepID=UPI003F6C52BE
MNKLVLTPCPQDMFPVPDSSQKTWGGSSRYLSLFVILCLSIVSGCASLSPDFEDPQVDVLSIKRIPSEDLEQRFAVGLRMTNPNDSELKLKGISYSLSIEGYKVASGVSADVPTLAPYGEARFSLPVSTSLLNSIRLLKHLMELNKSSLSYRLEAKLDMGIPFVPKTRVVEEGNVQLGHLQ